MRTPAVRWIVVPLLALFAQHLWAEDAPGAFDPGAAPPDLPKGEETFLERADAPDLRAFVSKLRKQIEGFETPPPATPEVTALRDAWSSILRPRASRMVRRLEKWEDAKYWSPPEEAGQPATLVPEAWTPFVRDMAALATELHGAWKQYGTVKLKAKEPLQGSAYYPRPPSVYLGYPYPALYGSILDRQAVARREGVWGAPTYWHLLNRFDYAWEWAWERRLRWYEYWQNRQQATEELFANLRAELDRTRDALGQTMLGLQVFVATLQNAEEERLDGLCHACRSDDATLREMGETALSAMEEARLQGERYQGASSSAYGSILRKWVRAQKAAAKVMEVAYEPAESESAEPEAEPQAPDR